jgi:hypothetical protein
MIAAKFVNIIDFDLKNLAADLRSRTTFIMKCKSGDFLHMYDCMYGATYDKNSTISKYTNKSFLEYVEDQEKDGTYADEIAIFIIARMYKINIQVFSSDAKLQLFTANENSRQPQPTFDSRRNTTISIVNRESKHFYGTKAISPEERPPQFPARASTTGEVKTEDKESPATTEFYQRIDKYGLNFNPSFETLPSRKGDLYSAIVKSVNALPDVNNSTMDFVNAFKLRQLSPNQLKEYVLATLSNYKEQFEHEQHILQHLPEGLTQIQSVTNIQEYIALHRKAADEFIIKTLSRTFKLNFMIMT